jgi:hypothetical protein
MRAILGVLLLSACANDNSITQLCGHERDAFNIEDVSVLQEAQAFSGMHDAVILDFDSAELPEGSAWRVESVEILPMIPQSDVDTYRDGQDVTVQVFDGDNPDVAPAYAVTQTFDRGLLAWDDVTLSSPENTAEKRQTKAWWTFPFDDAIPTTGMAGPSYIVGVEWDHSGAPTLGYSKYNLDCAVNWTDYDDGVGWVLNGDTGGKECNWPMLRVHVQVLEERANCEGDSVVVR